jgi:acyl carrier protein
MNTKLAEKPKDLKNQIKEALAEALGLEVEDINEDDSLTADLHMRPSDLADFVEKLDSLNLNTSKIELTEIETVGELVDSATDDEYLE